MPFWGTVKPSGSNAAAASPVDNGGGRNATGGFSGYPRGLIERRVVGVRANIWPIHPDVQQAIQQGRHLNMKAVVRGMRGTGKSTIVSKLCGYIPSVHYTPSAEISAGTFFYSSRVSKAPIAGCVGAKVELWDVVDEGASRDSQEGVAVTRTIDVYRGCHVALFVVDRRRRESLEYVVREAPHVPLTTSIVIVLNFLDTPKDSHVVVERDVLTVCGSLRRTTTPMFLAASAGRPPPDSYSTSAMFVSTSATMGDGLDFLWDAFEAPYVLLRVLALEDEISSCFQHIESHCTATVTELVRRGSAAERELQGLAKGESVTTTSASDVQQENDYSMSVSKGDRLFLTHAAVRARASLLCGDGEVEENGIAKGFFDDIEDDEMRAGCDGVADAGVNIESEESPADSTAEGPDEATNSRSFVCMRPLVVAGTTLPVRRTGTGFGDLLVSEDYVGGSSARVPRVCHPEGSTLDELGDTLNVGEATTLDDDFFGVGEDGAEEGSRLADGESVAGRGSDDDEGVPAASRSQLGEAVPEGTVSQVKRLVASPVDFQANVNILFQEMRDTLLTSTGHTKESLCVSGDKRKSRCERKKEKGENPPKKRGAADHRQASEVRPTNYDDGTFDVIQDW